jgi:hypothetical protein
MAAQGLAAHRANLLYLRTPWTPRRNAAREQRVKLCKNSPTGLGAVEDLFEAVQTFVKVPRKRLEFRQAGQGFDFQPHFGRNPRMVGIRHITVAHAAREKIPPFGLNKGDD